MQSLTLQRKASYGLRSAIDQNGQALGVVDLQHLDLDDPEFEDVVRRHIAKKRTQAEAEQLINRLRAMTADPGAVTNPDDPSAELVAKAKARAEKTGTTFTQALCDTSLEFPELARAHRQQVLSDTAGGLSKAGFNNRPRSQELHERILARAKEKNISYGEARPEIEAEFPELVSAARREGGLQVKDTKQLQNGAEMVVCVDTELGKLEDPSGWVAEMARNRSRNKGIAYAMGLSEIARDYPRLAAAADRQVKRLGEFA
jgi:hypothetical protein